MFDVGLGGPGFVAVGFSRSDGPTQGEVWTSADGATWNRSSPLATSHWVRLGAIATWNGGLIVAGADGDRAAFWTSEDAITWKRLPTDESLEFCLTHCRYYDGWIDRMFVEDDALVVLGSLRCDCGTAAPRRIVWRTTDGRTWAVERLEPSEEPPSNAIYAGDAWLRVAGVWDSDADTWRATVQRSVDNSTWGVVYLGLLGSWLADITATSYGSVGVGSTDVGDALVVVSTDGLSWDAVVPAGDLTHASMRAVAASDERIVAVGEHLREAAVFVSPGAPGV